MILISIHLLFLSFYFIILCNLKYVYTLLRYNETDIFLDMTNSGKHKNYVFRYLLLLNRSPIRTGVERIELPLKVLETLVIPFDQTPIFIESYTFKTTHRFFLVLRNSRSSPRPISISQLHMLPCFHL